MLFTEWDMDKALAVSKEEAIQEEQEKTIRAFSDILEPEVIAEKLQKPVEYVLKVLEDASYVCEDAVPYTAGKKE